MHAARVRHFSFLRRQRLKSRFFFVVVFVLFFFFFFFFLHSQSFSKHLSFSHLRLPSFFFQFAFEFPGGFLPSLVLPLPEPGDEVHAIGVRERRDAANARRFLVFVVVVLVVVLVTSGGGRFVGRLLLRRRRRLLPRLSSSHHVNETPIHRKARVRRRLRRRLLRLQRNTRAKRKTERTKERKKERRQQSPKREAALCREYGYSVVGLGKANVSKGVVLFPFICLGFY